MNWLFRCNIASERHGDQVVHGIGHAMRCISLAREINKQGHNALLSVEGDADVEKFLNQENADYVRNNDHKKVAKDINADIIVTDINYLSKKIIQKYKTIAPVVNLAPRGVPKYYADLTFTSERIRDVPEPEGSPDNAWLAGPEYTIINDDFISERRRLEVENGDILQKLPVSERVVVHMGGVDKSNRTSQVIESLSDPLIEQYDFTVVVGPFNPHVSEIKKQAKSNDITICESPSNLATVFLGAKLAILGTGISTYESLAVGVPSANVGVSEFHDKRGDILEEQSLGIYLGNQDDLVPNEITNKLTDFLRNDTKRNRIRENGFNRVDGRASKRIIQNVEEELLYS